MNRRQSIITARSFGGFDKSFDSILKTCKLIHDPENWKIWQDDIGNKLEVDKDRYFKVTKPKKYNYKNITDIYFKSKSEQIAKASQWFAFLIGKDLKKNIEYILIWFLGKDSRLRVCVLKGGKWIENLPPLLQNFELLLSIAENFKKQKLTQVNINSFNYGKIELSNVECYCGQLNSKNLKTLRKKTRHKKRTMESLGQYA